MIIEKVTWEVMDVGTYPARVLDVTREESQYGPQLRLRFRLESGDTVAGWVGAKLSERTKLGAWVRALLGEVPDSLHTESLLDRECRVVVGVKTRPDGSQYNRVDEVLSPRPRQAELPRPAQGEATCAECGAPADCHTPDGRGWCNEHAPVDLSA